MFETLKQAFKVKEIRIKIWITLALLLVYRLGCYIPVPGVGTELIKSDTVNSLSYLNIMNMMTGGSLQTGTLFAMGIGPYINSSIIIQLLAVAIPSLERLSKQGEEGRKKISQYTRYLTIILAVIQATGILINYSDTLVASDNATPLANMLFGQEWLAYVVVILFFTAGTVVTMWLGERITDYGVSNGISLLIFAGIISSAGQAFIPMIGNIWSKDGGNLNNFWKLVFMVVAIIVVFTCIVTVELAERKIPVQYAKQIRGQKMYGGQSTVIPIKVNSNGVLPLIFAFSILSFPELIMTLFGWSDSSFGIWWAQWMGTSSWLYMVVLSLLIIFFAYFYTSIQFNPDDISKSIQQNGGFIMGIRPGKPTAQYLKKISGRITLFGAIFLAFIALVPSIIFKAIDPTSYNVFTATGMLIVVSVAIEFNTALQSQIMMKNYKGFLK